MKILDLTTEFLLITAVTFLVSSLVTFFYNLLIHSNGIFDWDTAFRLSITIGIVFSWLHYREKNKTKVNE